MSTYESVLPVAPAQFPSGDASGTLGKLATDPKAVLLSEEMAKFLKAKVGDRLYVLLARATGNQVESVEQSRWLRVTLAEPQTPGTWTVVAMHHPAYSAGYHGSEQSVRQAWTSVRRVRRAARTRRARHDYQRSLPQDGVTYVVSGAAAKLRPTGQAPFTAVSSSTFHFVDLLFYDDQIIGRAIDQSGRLVDTFTIER